ncbi:hypothetical protein SGQ44_07635 [Flavobacterium sp. Fl-77]|uniref:Uncharacterized protein n=1 Tax=Flavobacterium flavipigmentatum TaxID=2893884 RepID=A0AAJ2VW81_9FLAO|nr:MULTISPECIES: hypothetical protein [unclassified Flavobacterium]MDX6182465.1 hypothetical protein [Flavobacterium sp. Fl-33]MDX6185622.1 hypothetical protein [Flavobacterium sp. Fl-77]UFH38808.1 hypothetical protein LNP22_00685 [Flavobacterium sp. F-70]
MDKKLKRRKIFYVPGMISLIFIPLMCFYYFYKIDAFKVYGSLEFGIPDKEDFEKYKVEDLRKYRTFSFNEKKSKHKQQLNELRFFTRDLVKRFDSINGAKIHFGSKTDYDTFVSIMDIMVEEKMPVWALFSDNMYAFAHAKPKKKHGFICGTMASTRENTLRMEEENQKKELHVFQVSFFKEQWILFLGYLGIALLNIFALVKFNKNK